MDPQWTITGAISLFTKRDKTAYLTGFCLKYRREIDAPLFPITKKAVSQWRPVVQSIRREFFTTSMKFLQILLNEAQSKQHNIFTTVVETVIQYCNAISVFTFYLVKSIDAIVFINRNSTIGK